MLVEDTEIETINARIMGLRSLLVIFFATPVAVFYRAFRWLRRSSVESLSGEGADRVESIRLGSITARILDPVAGFREPV